MLEIGLRMCGFWLTCLLQLQLLLAGGQAGAGEETPEIESIKTSYKIIINYAIDPPLAPQLEGGVRVNLSQTLERLQLAPLEEPTTGSNQELRRILDFYRQATAQAPTQITPLFTAAMNGMVEALNDRYASYLDRAQVNLITDLSRGSFGGVGLYIEQNRDAAGESTVVVSGVLTDGPAYRAGVHAFDRIVSVDQQQTRGMSLVEVQQKIRGRAGSRVSLTLERGQVYTFDADIVRSKIELPTSKSLLLNNKVLYSRILQFTPYTAKRFLAGFRTLSEEKSVDALILDLRNNPGGLLDASVDFADLFLDQGVIATTRSRIASEVNTFQAQRKQQIDERIRLVILTNEATASGAEIVAAALHEHRQARIIGSQTFGKGTVQMPFSLARGLLKLTIAHYYTADGRNLADHGIIPDEEVAEPLLSTLSSQERAKVLKIYERRILQDFIRSYPQMAVNEIEELKNNLAEQNLNLSERTLYYLIKSELNRLTIDVNPIALGFDALVKAALNYLSS